MITGIGIDAVRISRLEKWVSNPDLVQRFFHPCEVEAVKEKGSGMLSALAARFAAKEAFGKALGTGLAGIALKDIMIINDGNGRPELKVEGSALKALRAAGTERIHVSLTHEKDTAIASVVLEA